MHAMKIPARSYTPYGYSSARDSQLGFNGAFQDAHCGLYPLGNGYRIYSPVTMRFVSPDSLSPFSGGGCNSYAYCQGDPINYTDHSGHNRYFFTIGRVIKSSYRTAPKALAAKANSLPPNPLKGYLNEAFEIFMETSFPASPAKLSSELTRAPLTQALADMNAPAPFAHKVKAVVKNKISHGKPPIDTSLQASYIENISATNKGEISSVTAHLNMIGQWRRHGGTAGDVATVLHVASAAISGVEDQAQYKTGRIFQRG